MALKQAGAAVKLAVPAFAAINLVKKRGWMPRFFSFLKTPGADL